MPSIAFSAVSADPSWWWFWVVLSAVPDTLFVVSLIVLWRRLAHSRVRSLEQAGDLELARRFQVVAENASDIVMETDDGGRIVWVTPSVVQQLGLRPEELVGTPYNGGVHPDDRTIVHTLEQQVTKGTAASGELRLRRADGSYRWFFLSMRPRFDDRHTVVGHVDGWRDIHDTVLARETIDIERRRLHAQMASMINPLVLGEPVRDGAGRMVDLGCVDVNSAACAFFGTGRERLLGRKLLDLLPPLESTGLLSRFAETADTGRATVIDDFPLPMAGGEVHWLDVRSVRADGWVSIVWQDNTQRHRALERISASEEQFRLLAENSLDVIVRIDRNDTVVWVSPSVTSVLGWNVADCIGHSALDFLVTEETRQQYRRDKAQVFSGAGTVSRSQIRSATGEMHWMEAHSSPFRGADGRIDGLIAAVRLIDAEVRTEQALERRARIDDLTGLFNRSELLDQLGRLVEHGEPGLAVLWCDIDLFKEINDAHGHAAGDAVLRGLGERIRGCLPTPADLGARIGGDELMVVLRGVHDLDAAARMAEQLRDAAAAPIPSADGTINVTLSIGVTLVGPDESVDTLMARADDAMYRAKKAGRNRVVTIPVPGQAAAVAS